MAGNTLRLVGTPSKGRTRKEARARQRAGLEYAAGGVRAAMSALAALDMLHAAGTLDDFKTANLQQREAVDMLLRQTRRQLRAAVGSADNPGYDVFLDMLSEHGLDVYDD